MNPEPSRRPRNNSLRGQAREYQSKHPGVPYTSALEIVRRSDTPVISLKGWEFLIGQQRAIESLHALRIAHRLDIELASRTGDPSRILPLRAVFTGPPGCGKSMAARYLASEDYPEGEFVVTQPTELVGTTLEAASQKIQQVFEQSREGVLVVDSVHDFTPLHEGDSFRVKLLVLFIRALAYDFPAANVIVMTSPKSWEVLYCGSTTPLTRTLCCRFRNYVEFTSPTADDLYEKVLSVVHDEGMEISEDALIELRNGIHALESEPDRSGTRVLDLMGNFRMTRNLVTHMCHVFAERISTAGIPLKDAPFIFEPEDVRAALDAARRAWDIPSKR